MSLEKQEGMGYLELDKLSFLCRDVGVLSKPSRSVSSSVDGVCLLYTSDAADEVY